MAHIAGIFDRRGQMMNKEIISKYSSSAIANYFIRKAREDNVRDLTQLKLQKLVYIALGWALSLANTDIVGGDDVEAWQYGPVIPNLYHSIKHFRNDNIVEPIPGWFSVIDDDGNEVSAPVPDEVSNDDEDVLEVLEAVWDVYKDKTANELVNITHRHNTPWKMYYKSGKRNIDIPKEDIKAFYDALREKSES